MPSPARKLVVGLALAAIGIAVLWFSEWGGVTESKGVILVKWGISPIAIVFGFIATGVGLLLAASAIVSDGARGAWARHVPVPLQDGDD